jgi:D-glycero-D-manno-heptose 1,7-bisphosphate phosphatase
VVFHDNNKPSSPWLFEEFKLIPGIKKPLEELSNMGFLLFIISNQPDVARGNIKKDVIEKINKIIYYNYPIKEILICPHDDSQQCDCRKPKPGMIISLSKKWEIDIKKSYLIGDSWKDIEAGKKAGCKTILLDKNYNQSVEADYRTDDLESAVEIIKSANKNPF